MLETPVRYYIDHECEYEDKNGSGDQGRDSAFVLIALELSFLFDLRNLDICFSLTNYDILTQVSHPKNLVEAW